MDFVKHGYFVIINGIMKKQELFFPYLKTLGGRNL
jgi:hypothetical protein